MVHHPGRPDVRRLRRRHPGDALRAVAQTGLDLPGDAETLAGKSLAIGVGSGFDPEMLVNSGDGSGVPVAVKVQGDVEGIEGVLDKVRGRMGGGTTPLDSDSSGDMVVIGPDADYRKQVLSDGGSGRRRPSPAWCRRPKDSSAVLFVNFDAAGGSWLTSWPAATGRSRTTSSRSRPSASAAGRTATPATPCSASPRTDRAVVGTLRVSTGQLRALRVLTGQLWPRSLSGRARCGALSSAALECPVAL